VLEGGGVLAASVIGGQIFRNVAFTRNAVGRDLEWMLDLGTLRDRLLVFIVGVIALVSALIQTLPDPARRPARLCSSLRRRPALGPQDGRMLKGPNNHGCGNMGEVISRISRNSR
jgi:hypothetical protein